MDDPTGHTLPANRRLPEYSEVVVTIHAVSTRHTTTLLGLWAKRCQTARNGVRYAGIWERVTKVRIRDTRCRGGAVRTRFVRLVHGRCRAERGKHRR